MAEWPSDNQDPWGDTLRAYIDELNGLPAEERDAPLANARALVLRYNSPIDDPDLYVIRYLPPGGIAEGLPLIHQATFVLNERGFLRLQAAPDFPSDVPLRIFGRGDTGAFTAAPFQIIPNRLNQANVAFEIDADGRIDTGRYPWSGIDYGASARYGEPSGTTYHPAAVRRISSDRCEFRGSVNIADNTIAVNDVVGSVDAEFCPSRTVRLSGSAGGGAQPVRMELAPSGVITLLTARTAAGYMSLDGVSYTL